MTKELEIEFKNLLTAQEFAAVRKHFGLLKHDFIQQTNYYFDTENFDLKNSGSALRVRKRANKYELTLKEPAKIGIYESNQDISSLQFNKMYKTNHLPEGAVKKALEKQKINLHNLQFFGKLTTSRAESPYKKGLIALDESSYLNFTDYEIEYEVEDPLLGESIFKDLLDSLKIENKKTDNKIERFYKRKLSLQE